MDINNSQNAPYTILDLPKLIKIAREHTLLGKYETSIKKYQIALEIIQARKKEVKVGVLRDKWQMTELNIKSEISFGLKIDKLKRISIPNDKIRKINNPI